MPGCLRRQLVPEVWERGQRRCCGAGPSPAGAETPLPACDGKRVPPAQWWEGSLIPAAGWRLLCVVKAAFCPLPFLLVMHGENR